MHTYRPVVDLGFFCFSVLLIIFGGLQFFWRSQLKALRDRFWRYNIESPLGRVVVYAHSKGETVLSRISGLLLLLVGLVFLVLFLFGHKALSR